MGDSPNVEATLDSVALEQLNSPETKELLDTIDSLRQLHVGGFVDLPQIIVVGDQSSGKSSVLEAISQVQFPVKGDLCTRFATELVLRRASESRVQVSIQFAGETSPDDSSEPFLRTSFDKDDLPEIIDEAKQRMDRRDGTSKGFSKHVLRVEIAGPKVYALTLVDLPGFFHSETAEQSQEGKEIVDQLVESYMKQKNSIILAVISANNQLANQKVLTEAKKHDPTRERTLGVITKPDLPRPGSADERKALQLAQGEEAANRLTLGWHVLRNRSEDEESTAAEDRDAREEAFFRTGAWNSIPEHSRGVENLRKKLTKVLLTHIRKILPGLISDIESHLRTRQDKLERLGKPRSSPEELRSYLLDIAESFQRLARDAVDGRYHDPFFGEESNRKLRAILRNLNRAFHATMLTKGAKQEIIWESNLDDGIDTDDNVNNKDETTRRNKVNPKVEEFPDHLQPFIDYYDFKDPEPVLESDLKSSTELLAAANQGTEFPGMPNSSLVVQMFKTQSVRWKEITEFHLDLVTNFSKVVVEQLVSHIIGADTATTTAVLRGCVDPFFDSKKATIAAKLDELLRPYTAGFGVPLDREFHSTSSKRSRQRLADQVEKAFKSSHPGMFERRPMDGLTRQKIFNAIAVAEDGWDSMFGTDKAIDMMVAYYDMSLRTFVENIINLAVESCLICDIPDMLTPRKVDQMKENQLKELAAESEEVQSERKALEAQARILRDGLQKCQQYRPREMTVLPPSLSRRSALTTSRQLVIRPPSLAQATPAPKATLNSSAHATSILATASNGSPSAATSQVSKPFSTLAQSTTQSVPASLASGSPGDKSQIASKTSVISSTVASRNIKPLGFSSASTAPGLEPFSFATGIGSKSEKGSTASVFGSSAASGGGGLSGFLPTPAPALSAGLFGSKSEKSSTASVFGSSAASGGGGLFGSSSTPAPALSGGLFGSTSLAGSTASVIGKNSTFGGFGTQQTATGTGATLRSPDFASKTS